MVGLLVVDCGCRSISLNWVAGVWTEEGPAIILPSLIPPLTFKSGKWDTFQNCFDNLSSSTLGKVLQNKQDFAESACLVGWVAGYGEAALSRRWSLFALQARRLLDFSTVLTKVTTLAISSISGTFLELKRSCNLLPVELRLQWGIWSVHSDAPREVFPKKSSLIPPCLFWNY